MRALPRSFVPLIFALWACGGDAAAPPLAPALPVAPAASAPPAPAAVSPPQAWPAAADVEPTPLTEEQKRRDAALARTARFLQDQLKARPWRG